MLTAEDVLRRVKLMPFIPFRILTSSGETYDVSHPELIMVGRRSLLLGTASKNNPIVYDKYSIVSMLHVTALEDLPTTKTSASQGNGEA